PDHGARRGARRLHHAVGLRRGYHPRSAERCARAVAAGRRSAVPDRVMTQRAYAGLKVIALSQGVAGPYCGMLLAQHGADVIKIEPTGEGDWSRTLGRRYGGHTAYSIPANLGKRSIALDLKAIEGKEVLWRLIGGADVLL